MDLVFSFRHPHIRAGRRPAPDRGRARRDRRGRTGARGLSRRGRAWLSSSSVENLSAGYGEARVIQGLGFTLEDGRSLALLGRNGVGKTTLIDTLIGVDDAVRRADRARRRGHRGAASAPARPSGRRLDAAGAQYLPLADGRGEPDRGRASRPMDGEARLRAVSPPRGAADQHGPATVGRRAADAGDRARADAEPAPAPARRADRGPRADHRRRTLWRRCASSHAKACR